MSNICINKPAYFIFICLVFGSCQSVLLAQDEGYIRGKIIDSNTKNPIPFATVRLKDYQIGVFANAEGDFRVIHDSRFNNDSLIISCIGFKRTSISFSDLSDTQVNKIILAPATYGIGEIKVIASRKKLKSVDLISRAIRNIRNNYPSKPFNYIAYYRDYQKKDGNYQNLNEAIIQILDVGFKTASIFNNYRLLDFRKNIDFARVDISPYYDSDNIPDGFASDKYIPNASLGDQFGNELFVLMVHDALRNYRVRSFSFIDVLAQNFMVNHYFAEPQPVYDNNLLLYKIFFNAKTKLTGDSLLVIGAIYIQPRDYTIHKIEYTCYYMITRKEKKEMFNIDIEYGYENSIGSPMYLKYISFNNIFRVVDPADNSYFRVVDSYLLPSKIENSTMVLVFNNMIEQKSAMQKKNYDITIDEKPIKIRSIEVKGRRLIISLKTTNLETKISRCNIFIKNISDNRGNMVNRKKTIELNQYRELFVQGYNQNVQYTDSCYMDYLPIEKNCISKTSSSEKYWMNTPENIKIK